MQKAQHVKYFSLSSLPLTLIRAVSRERDCEVGVHITPLETAESQWVGVKWQAETALLPLLVEAVNSATE